VRNDEFTAGEQLLNCGLPHSLHPRERCSPAALGFLRSTHAGRAAPPVEENWDSKDESVEAEAHEAEVGEWRSKRSSDPRASGIGFHL